MKSIFNVPLLVTNVFKYDSREELDYKTLSKVSVFFGIIIYLENFNNINNLKVVLFTYLVGTALILVPIITKRMNNKRKYFRGYAITFAAALTLYALFGINDGMDNYWSILIIIVIMLLFGMPTGLIWGTYYFVLSVIFFWTPVRNTLPYTYDTGYAIAFPIMFFAAFSGSFAVNLIYKRGRIEQEARDLQLQRELDNALSGIDEAMIDSVKIISTLIDGRDMYTKEHSVRVARYAKQIANEYGFGDDVKRMRSIYNAALLHDIGKIAIPDEILKHRHRLTDKEYELMKLHTTYGEEILRELTFLPTVYYGAKYHHERLDGAGYPSGMLEKDIPIEAKIITAADSLDAMNSKRVYRDPCSKEYIIDAFLNGIGTEFDEKIARIVINLINEGKITIVSEEQKEQEEV